MKRTWMSLLTALALALLALSMFVLRYSTQGANMAGPRAEQVWKVTMLAAGDLQVQDDGVTMGLPLEFRRQHIFDEHFQSDELRARVRKSKNPGRREAAWHRSGMTKAKAVRLNYTFHCATNVRLPTRLMTHLTRQLDARPAPEEVLKPEPGIESDSKEILHLARELVVENSSVEVEAKALFDYVDDLANEPSVGPRSALDCLNKRGSDSEGKSRLLVALCRSRSIPSRLVTGVVLLHGQQQRVHHWAEAWVDSHWLPMCPTAHHFGQREFPGNYLVLQLGSGDLVRSQSGPFQVGFQVQAVQEATTSAGDQPASSLHAFWRRVSLYSLRPVEQRVVKFLLLLPLAALIVSFFRTVVGLNTFGTFGPALLGLAFLDLKSLHWGLLLFVLTVLVGWAMRHLLDRFHLLLVPRTSILLTLIVTFLIAMILVASHYDIMGSTIISLFPLVILTHLVERFWTVEAEDGTAASFRTLLETLGVAVTVSLALSPHAVTSWMFRYPETLGLVLAVQFVLGRYTGYRLTELYRFDDLWHNKPLPGSKP